MIISDYKCDRCYVEASAVSGAIGYYRFADSCDQFVLTKPVWCNQCLTITLAEALPDIDFLRTELDRYNRGSFTEADREHAEMFSETLETLVASRTQSIRNWIFRFEHRTEPGRCIECGSCSFQGLRSFSDGDCLPDAFVHPAAVVC